MSAVDVRAFDSAYPGSMFAAKDGSYVRRDDSANLAASLLEIVDSLRRELEDAQAVLIANDAEGKLQWDRVAKALGGDPDCVDDVFRKADAMTELMAAVNNGVPTERGGKVGLWFHPIHAEGLRAAFAHCRGESP